MTLSAPIAVDDLSKFYPTRDARVTALERISFSVGEGEFVAVVGPFCVTVGAWEAVVRGLEIPGFILPPPSRPPSGPLLGRLGEGRRRGQGRCLHMKRAGVSAPFAA